MPDQHTVNTVNTWLIVGQTPETPLVVREVTQLI